VERLLQIARLHYDFIVIDMGRYINATAIRALDSADLICPVLQQSLPYLRDARRLLDIYASLGYRKEKIQCVLNRFESNAGLSLAEIERVLGQKIAQRIPNHFEIVNDSINQGRPVLQLARSSDISKALSTWVNRLVEVPTPARGGMLRRIFERHPVNSGLMR
jgi:pilus assembly protein CpaE